MSSIGFDETVIVRVRGFEKEAIIEIVKDHPEIFSSEAHFTRAAILSFVRNWKKEYDKETETFKY